MCDISTFYNKPKYLPFLIYCREHHYTTMDDLARCPFHLLIKEPGFTSILASRVKAMYLIYLKKQKEEPAAAEPQEQPMQEPIVEEKPIAQPAAQPKTTARPATATAQPRPTVSAPAAAKPKPVQTVRRVVPPAVAKVSRTKAAPAAKAMTQPDIVKILHEYFQKNGDRLITIDDANKAVGGRVKRAEITKILQDVAWCQVVDKGTFFYSPVK